MYKTSKAKKPLKRQIIYLVKRRFVMLNLQVALFYKVLKIRYLTLKRQNTLKQPHHRDRTDNISDDL